MRKPGGVDRQVLLLDGERPACQADRRGIADMAKMAYPSVEEHRELLSKAGSSEVRGVDRPDKGRICGAGRKPR
jgi:hypothetical protein